MERSLGATFFLIASVAFALAFGAWWLDRVAFSPDDTVDSAAAYTPGIRLALPFARDARGIVVGLENIIDIGIRTRS